MYIYIYVCMNAHTPTNMSMWSGGQFGSVELHCSTLNLIACMTKHHWQARCSETRRWKPSLLNRSMCVPATLQLWLNAAGRQWTRAGSEIHWLLHENPEQVMSDVPEGMCLRDSRPSFFKQAGLKRALEPSLRSFRTRRPAPDGCENGAKLPCLGSKGFWILDSGVACGFRPGADDFKDVFGLTSPEATIMTFAGW